MRRKIITSILVLILFLGACGPDSFGACQQNSLPFASAQGKLTGEKSSNLRPVAIGEKNEDSSLELEIEIRILLASATGMQELIGKFNDGTFGPGEWVITVEILDKLLRAESSNIVLRFGDMIDEFEKVHQKICRQLREEEEAKRAGYVDRRYRGLIPLLVRAYRKQNFGLPMLPKRQLPPAKTMDVLTAQI